MIIRGDTITYFSENSHLFAGQIFLGFIFPLALYNGIDAASGTVWCKSALRHCHVIVIFLSRASAIIHYSVLRRIFGHIRGTEKGA
jgi:hypothetical protein